MRNGSYEFTLLCRGTRQNRAISTLSVLSTLPKFRATRDDFRRELFVRKEKLLVRVTEVCWVKREASALCLRIQVSCIYKHWGLSSVFFIVSWLASSHPRRSGIFASVEGFLVGKAPFSCYLAMELNFVTVAWNHWLLKNTQRVIPEELKRKYG